MIQVSYDPIIHWYKEGKPYGGGLNIGWINGPIFVWYEPTLKIRLRIRIWPPKVFFSKECRGE